MYHIECANEPRGEGNGFESCPIGTPGAVYFVYDGIDLVDGFDSYEEARDFKVARDWTQVVA